MKKKDIIDFIFNNIQILFLTALCFLVCSQSFIHTFWMSEITQYLIFEYNTGFNLCFICILIIFILLCFKNKNISISYKKYISTLCVINIAYIYFRFSYSDDFAFFFCSFSYFDCFFIVSTIALFSKFLYDYFKTRNENKTTCLLKSDAPIKSFEEDKLERKGLVFSLSEEILTLNSIDYAHSIALISPWGSGKTSFLNLLKLSLKQENKKDIEIIEFCPWHLSSKKDYTEEFFKKISNVLKFQDNSLYKIIKDYIPLVTNTKKDFFSKFEDHFFDSYSSFDFVADEIRKSGKTFIIIIDDIDRLDANEIKDILKIIRGSANFPNFIFIVAFDKQYVESTLKEDGTAIDKNYLKKFFNIEYHLPICKQSTIKEILIDFSKSLDGPGKVQFLDYINVDEHPIIHGFNPLEYINDIRDTNRWINAIIMDLEKLKNEVRITDLANLELLKLNFPQAYYLIKKEKNTFLEVRRNRYILYRNRDNKTDDIFSQIATKDKTEIFTTDEIKSLGEMGVNKLEKLLDQLFPDSYNYIQHKSICDIAYFERYFQTILSSEDVSDSEFDSMINMNYQDITDYLTKNIERKNLSLNRRFQYYIPKNQEVVKNIIRAIFAVCKNDSKHIINPDNVHRLIETIDESEKRDFVKKVFLENGYSEYVCQTLKRTYGISDWNDFVTIEEKSDIYASMLDFAISENKPMNNVYNAFHNSIIFDNKQNPHYNLKSQNLLWKVATTRPKEFLSFIIIKDHKHSDKEMYWNLLGTCEFMWKDDLYFESKVQQLSDCEIIDEFLDFYHKYKNNKYQSTKYKFNKIKEDEIMMKY